MLAKGKQFYTSILRSAQCFIFIFFLDGPIKEVHLYPPPKKKKKKKKINKKPYQKKKKKKKKKTKKKKKN